MNPSVQASASSNEVLSAYLIKSLSSRDDFGYISGGYCGYIAANILLFWLDRTQNSDIVDNQYIYGYRLNGSGLTEFLISIGEELGIGSGTYASDIHSILQNTLMTDIYQLVIKKFTSFYKFCQKTN